MTQPANTILFAGGHHNLLEARQYIKDHNLSEDDAKLYKTDSGLYVRTKRRIEWKSE
jgi:hypothetical protein